METLSGGPPSSPTPLGRGLRRGEVRPIPPIPNIQQRFVATTARALERGTIAQTFFGGIGEAIDHHLSIALDSVPPDLLPFLRAFCT